MTRFLWWLKKEFREHRVLLVLLVLAIPLGSWLAVHLTRGRPPTPEQLRQQADQRSAIDPDVPLKHGPDLMIGPVPHNWHRTEWEGMLLVSFAVAAAAVAGGLFAAESRRGMVPLIARTPGAWLTALVAKGAFLALVLGGTLLLHGWVLGRLASAYTLVDVLAPYPGTVDTWILLLRGETWLVYAALVVLSLWVLLASAALPLVGVPLLVGVTVGVGVAIPTLIWEDTYPYFFRWWIGGIPPLLGVAALAAILLLALVWLRWDRFRRSAKYVGLRLGLLVALFFVIGNGVTCAAASRYHEVGADAPDLRLAGGIMGVGDRFVYLLAYRGDPDAGAESREYELRGTLAAPWRVDLHTGGWAAVGRPGEQWLPSQEEIAQMGFQWPQALLFHADDDLNARTGTWFDARSGERLERGDSMKLPPGSTERLRAAFRAETGVRDAQGRPTWILGASIERDGAEPISLSERLGRLTEIPGGWSEGGSTWLGTRGGVTVPTLGGILRSVEADTGRIRTYPQPGQPTLPGYLIGWWDPHHAIVQREEGKPHPARSFVSIDAAAVALGRWQLLDLDTGTTAPLTSDLPADLASATPLARVGPDALLLHQTHPGPSAFSRWTRGVAAAERATWDGPSLEGVEFAAPLGLENASPPQAHVGRPVLVQALRSEPAGWAVKARQGRLYGFPSMQSFQLLEAWLVYDPAQNSVRVLRPWSRFQRDAPLRIQRNGVVLALEDLRRIVRLGPEPGQREVLFPRR